ncbi:MAG: hypothetical protein L3K15_07165, partial [Thermoplasmata archaeon]|nr:hypothetical protein [Thermoplasmata archaeon]
MGRPLVWLFLGSVGFAFVTVALGVIHLARDLWVVLGDLTHDSQLFPFPPPVPHPFQWNGPWLVASVWYFDIIVPLGLLLLFVVDRYRAVSVHRWREPDRFPIEGQKITVVLTAYNDESSIGQAVDEFGALADVGEVI